MSKRYGFNELLRDEGFDPADPDSVDEFLRMATFDEFPGGVPAICESCGYSTMYEPDQDRGWCEECNTQTVVSGLVLAGLV